MISLLTLQARHALSSARTIALERGSPWIGTDHLLYALVKDTSSASRVLSNIVPAYAIVLTQVERILGPVNRTPPTPSTTSPQASPDLVAVIGQAHVESVNLSHHNVDTMHFLLALFKVPHQFNPVKVLSLTYESVLREVERLDQIYHKVLSSSGLDQILPSDPVFPTLSDVEDPTSYLAKAFQLDGVMVFHLKAFQRICTYRLNLAELWTKTHASTPPYLPADP